LAQCQDGLHPQLWVEPMRSVVAAKDSDDAAPVENEKMRLAEEQGRSAE
jgi:hypothetical protein